MRRNVLPIVQVTLIALILSIGLVAFAGNGWGKGGKPKPGDPTPSDPGDGGSGGGGGGSVTSTINVPDGVFGEYVVASVRSDSSGLRVLFECSQAGDVVLRSYSNVSENGEATALMGPTPSWSGGAASCTAELGTWNNSRWRAEAETAFDVFDPQ